MRENKALSAKEREQWGLNPHKGPRTDRLFDLAYSSDDTHPEVVMRIEDIKKLLAMAKRENPENVALGFVMAYYYEGRPIAEIAYKMGVGVETAKTKLARAAKLFGKYVRSQEEE